MKDRCEPLLRLCARDCSNRLSELALRYMLHVRGIPLLSQCGDVHWLVENGRLFYEHDEFAIDMFGPRNRTNNNYDDDNSRVSSSVSVNVVSSTTSSPSDLSYDDEFGRNARSEYRRDPIDRTVSKVERIIDYDLVSLALKSLLLSHGLTFVLREIARLEMPWSVSCRLHRYFYRTSWNFLRFGRAYW